MRLFKHSGRHSENTQTPSHRRKSLQLWSMQFHNQNIWWPSEAQRGTKCLKKKHVCPSWQNHNGKRISWTIKVSFQYFELILFPIKRANYTVQNASIWAGVQVVPKNTLWNFWRTNSHDILGPIWTSWTTNLYNLALLRTTLDRLDFLKPLRTNLRRVIFWDTLYLLKNSWFWFV